MLLSVIASRAPVSAVGFPCQRPVLLAVAVETVFQLLLKLSRGVFPKKDICWRDFEQSVCRAKGLVDGQFWVALSVFASSPASGRAVMVSSKKGVRAVGGGIQNVSCLVDGCDSDLRDCREYHRRHKVCETHSKAPIVMVGGKEQRFCQQCSRFHLLGEFDEVKRSCRKRLDGHNRRRRKPQPQMVNPRNFFTAQQGHGFVPYQNLFTRVTPTPDWTSVMKYREKNSPNNNSQPVSVISRQEHSIQFSQDYKQAKRLPFLQDNAQTVTISRNGLIALDASVSQQHANNFSSSESSGSGQLLSEGLAQVFDSDCAPSEGLAQVFDSDCAPSLLSSPTQASSFNVATLVAAATSDQTPLVQPLVGQPLVGDLQQQQPHFALNKYSCLQSPAMVSSPGFCRPGIMEDHAGIVLVPDVNAADFGYPGIFNTGHLSPDDQTPGVPFAWQ